MTPPPTVSANAETLADVVLHYLSLGKRETLMAKRDGAFRALTSEELGTQIRSVSQALIELGVREGDRVAILSENRPEWAITDFAAQCAGAITVPLYPTLTAEQIGYILRDSGAAVVVASSRAQADKVLGVAIGAPHLLAIVLVEAGSGLPSCPTAKVLSWQQLLEKGASASAKEFESRARSRKPEDVATIIYTSGTTGEPKGVMLTHRNLVTNMKAAMDVISFSGDWTVISFLPLSHVYERLVDYAYFYCGLTIAYAESIEKLRDNLPEVRPHMFVAVPRVYEKIYAKILADVEVSPIKKAIFSRARKAAREMFEHLQAKTSPPAILRLRWALYDRLVYQKVKARLGGRFEYCLSGGAPLPAEIARFFIGIGIRIYEGYGLTETSPVISVNTPDAWKVGSVGRPLGNVEVKLAPDGEIVVRGPSVMRGYWNKPEATRAVLDAEGWFSTGDIGVIDSEGFLSITDRKKELIVDAYGKNMAPQPVENALKMRPWIMQAVLIGDQHPFISALIVPDFDKVRAWAAQIGRQVGDGSDAAIAADATVRELVAADVAEVNRHLAPYEQIRRFELLSAELTQEAGELTPTLKTKRRVVAEKYADRIARLYEGHS